MAKLLIRQGATFDSVIRVGTELLGYKAITGITQAAPVVITAPTHGLTTGWPVIIVSNKGMKQLNTDTSVTLQDTDYHPITVINSNSFSINDINSSDYSAYVSGGYVQYKVPHDLSGYMAVMTIGDKSPGTEPLLLTTENGGLTIDATAKTITCFISAVDTAALTWARGEYQLKLIDNNGIVTAFDPDVISVQKAVTT